MPSCGLLLLLVVSCPRIWVVGRILSSIVSVWRLCYRLLLWGLPLQSQRAGVAVPLFHVALSAAAEETK